MGSIREAAKCTVHTLSAWLEHDSPFIIIFVLLFFSIFLSVIIIFPWTGARLSISIYVVRFIFFLLQKYCSTFSMAWNMAGTWQPLHLFTFGHIHCFFFFFFEHNMILKFHSWLHTENYVIFLLPTKCSNKGWILLASDYLANWASIHQTQNEWKQICLKPMFTDIGDIFSITI